MSNNTYYMSETTAQVKIQRYLEGLDDEKLDYVLGLLRAFAFVLAEFPIKSEEFPPVSAAGNCSHKP
jgi:hypothetical protein